MGKKERFYVDIMTLHPEVTGSCILVIVKCPDNETIKFIVDCGMFQENEYANYNESFPFEADELKFAIVTHNHVDHTGRLPLLIKKGFRGKIFLTEQTGLLLPLALYDSYDVIKDIAKRKHEQELYSQANVAQTMNHLWTCKFNTTINVDENIRVTFFKNGHLPGAASVLVQISYLGMENINLLFSGDYNNKNMFFDVGELPKWVRELPITIVQESTYGYMNSTEKVECFEKNIISCIEKGGTVICPSFALGRFQEILYTIRTMQERGVLDLNIPIYADGKLGIRYTNLYINADLGIRANMLDFLPNNLTFVDKTFRKEILDSDESKIIVTTSGMGTYGPAQMYIPEYITRENSLIQFTGYTAEGTLGQKLKSSEKGDIITVGGILLKKNADVEYTTEFSAHAKADEMIDFLNQFENIKLILVNHGEYDSKRKFSERILREVHVKNVAISGRDYFYRVGPYGLIRSLTTKFE